MSAARRLARKRYKALEIPCKRLFGAKWVRLSRRTRMDPDKSFALIVDGAAELKRRVDLWRARA